MKKRFPKKNLNKEITKMEIKEEKEARQQPMLTEKVRKELNRPYQSNIKMAIIKVKKRKQKP